jgi:hypothetical protein
MGRGKCCLILRATQRKRIKRKREKIERKGRFKAVEAMTLRL